MILSKRREQVRLHLQDGPTLEGLLVSRSRGEYVLWDATVLSDQAIPTKLAGNVVLPASRVLFFQILAPAGHPALTA